MTILRIIAAHQVVQEAFPRPPPSEPDHIAMAAGKAIDGALAQLGHLFRQGQRPTSAKIVAAGERLFDEAIEEAGIAVGAPEREKVVAQLRSVLKAYRQSEIFGLARPRSRVIVIDGRVGVYAQPDYWDGKGRFYEMKSYRAVPPPPDVALQLRLFQLAFPQFRAILVCINRHSEPVETLSLAVPPLTQEEAAATLRLAYDVGLRLGQEKVLEYMEGPFVHYSRAGGPA